VAGFRGSRLRHCLVGSGPVWFMELLHELDI
jgi:hypothetical protein